MHFWNLLSQFTLLGITVVSLYLLIMSLIYSFKTDDLKNEFCLEGSEPRCSIIVPVHNEQIHLQSALESLCNLHYLNYEVIVINDRSSDNSLRIIESVSKCYDNLKVISVNQVPKNWFGKTYALQQGFEKATGEYIIFTDADVHFEKEVLSKTIQYMTRKSLDHLAVFPILNLCNLGMKVFMPFQIYIMMLSFSPWRTKKSNTRDAIGVGAFNAVRTDAISHIGGFKQIAMSPIDDIELARLLKKGAFKQSYVSSGGLLSLNWYDNLYQSFKGFEKNIFAFFDFDIKKCLVIFIVFLLYFFLPIYTALSCQFLGLSLIPIICTLIPVFIICKQLKISLIYALCYPLSAMLTLSIGIRAVLITLLRGGVVWGGIYFTLKKLRAFNRTKF